MLEIDKARWCDHWIVGQPNIGKTEPKKQPNKAKQLTQEKKHDGEVARKWVAWKHRHVSEKGILCESPCQKRSPSEALGLLERGISDRRVTSAIWLRNCSVRALATCTLLFPQNESYGEKEKITRKRHS